MNQYIEKIKYSLKGQATLDNKHVKWYPKNGKI